MLPMTGRRLARLDWISCNSFFVSMFFCQGGLGCLPTPLSTSGFLAAGEARQLPERRPGQGFQIAQLTRSNLFPKYTSFDCDDARPVGF